MVNKKLITENNKLNTNRSFGLLFFIIFLLIGIWPLKDGENLRIWSIFLSSIFLLLGLINSKFLTPFKIFWIKLGDFLGKLISPVVMSIIYFLILTPTGLIMRLLGKDILKLKKNTNKTYWQKKDKNVSKMKNQF